MNLTRGKVVFILAIMVVVGAVLFACTTPYPLPPQIRVTYPNGGEVVPVAYPVGGMEVTWTSTDISESEIVQVQISSDSGKTWKTVLFHDNTGLCLCPAPDSATQYGRVKVSCFVEGVGVVSDTSDGDFTTNEAGTGTHSFDYYAEYYDCGLFSSTPPDDIFTNPPAAPVTCMEGAIDYDWGDGAPESGGGVIQSDFFAARWSGIFHFDEGTYTFTATADDGVRVYLDGGEPIIREWEPHVATTHEVTKHISEGDHQVKVEYFERMGVAVCKLSWQLKWTDSNGVTWSSPQRVTDNPNKDDRPSIIETPTMGPLCVLTKWIFWNSKVTPTGNELFYKTATGEGPDQLPVWSDAIQLTTGGRGNYRPAPAIVVNGGTYALWLAWGAERPSSPGNYDIYYKYYYEQSPLNWQWSDEAILAPASGGSSLEEDPSIIQTQDGNIWIAWCSKVADACDIYLARSTDGGVSWDSYPAIEKLDYGGNEMYPSMTQIGEDIWIAFHADLDNDGDDEIHYAIYSISSNNLIGPWQFEPSPTLGTHPTIVQTQNGHVWIIWDRDGEIFYTVGDGVAWSPEVNITQNSAIDQAPWITQTWDGKIWVVWATNRDGNFEIYAMYGIPP